MIDRTEMMRVIIEACRGFAIAYESFMAEWRDVAEVPYYLALADFARYLIGLLESGNRQELDAAFAVIERLHLEGDRYVREAATVGILEDLQNTNLHSRTTPEQFVDFLRPVSLRFWKKVEDFWQHGTIITDD